MKKNAQVFISIADVFFHELMCYVNIAFIALVGGNYACVACAAG
jgi:hypothetical protein